jgi:hypothetical protein
MSAQNGPDNLKVCLFATAADAIGLPNLPCRSNNEERADMVFDIEPIAYIPPASVDRQTDALQGIDDDQGNELLRKVIGPIIVRAVGNECRQPVGMIPGADEVIRRGLRSGIRRVRTVRRCFGKVTGIRQRAEYFVSGDMLKVPRRSDIDSLS